VPWPISSTLPASAKIFLTSYDQALDHFERSLILPAEQKHSPYAAAATGTEEERTDPLPFEHP